jgi:glycosyltransferase involved in cell wall biosynthesis
VDASTSKTSLDAVGSPLTLRQELYDETSPYYEPMCAWPVQETPVKLIAFYLPQFHPIPENDLWWGRGFTEWTNVVRAKPQFQGHYQPHLPIDLGFYDLRIAEIQKQQIEMARHFGVFGFCYYYYWFNGRQLLDRPLLQVLQDSDLEFPYCICWANENWTRRWDGQDQEILIAQNHSSEGDLAFIQSLERFFRDRRYIKIDGKPVLIVYRADLLPHVKATIKSWRQYCLKCGIGEIYLVAARTFGFENPAPLGFDAAVEFPPHGVSAQEITSQVQLFNPKFRGRIFSYEDIVRQAQAFTRPKYPVFRTVMPLWDNSARRGNGGHIFAGSSPALYREWLESVCDYTMQQFPEGHRMVFVNAWNEWAEGAHLEPDRRYGYAYLNATASALRKFTGKEKISIRTRPVTISVIVPAYNHESYICKALESLEEQTASDFEVVVVDDGSTDRTAEIAEGVARKSRRNNVRVLNQDNMGAHAAINRGVEESVGDYIAILNSDDFYHPERLEVLLQSLKSSDAKFAFSDFEIVGKNSLPIFTDDPLADLLRTKVSQISQFPHLGYALLDFNIAVTSGNLFFSRELFDLIGGFSALRYCHDWDFALTALRYTTPIFVRRRLYNYRLHPGNSFRDLQDLAEKESQIVLSKFFMFEQSQGQVRRGFPGHKNDSQYFAQFIREHKYESYLRRALQIDVKAEGT